ncbi:MAG: beta-galactosidase [Clostridiales bacterium]|jgi:beta-galactosidase|nr:beta-galactosidase [Clostridiales bacterium]
MSDMRTPKKGIGDMGAIAWNKDSCLVNGKSEFLISGEVHYFRVPKADWAKRLDLLTAAGANAVATYVPWILHEPEEGKFRFQTAVSDLEGFLTLCERKGLFVIARPGPYQYSEMKFCGLPGWLFDKYPSILARNENGEILSNCSVSYLHPIFLEKTKAWFDKVLPIIARHDTKNGGNVALVQFDNELGGIHEWFGGLDRNPEVMGWRWEKFLKENPGASYKDFYLGTLAEYSKILVGWLREAGISCPIIHNAANPGMASYFLETRKALDKDFLLGVDMYYNLGMDFESNQPSPKQAATAFLGLEQLRLMEYPPVVLEMQAGNCVDWPPVTPADIKCWLFLNLAFGMKGVNYYVFTGGPNPHGIGGDGDMYDYCAPIGPAGEIRPTYEVLKSFGAFVKSNSWLAASSLESDYRLGLNWDHARNKGPAWDLLFKGVLLTSLCSGYTPELWDLDKEAPMDKPLVVCALDIPESQQRILARFVKAGGKLLVLPCIPPLLQSLLGLNVCEESNSFNFCFQNLTNINCNALWACDAPKGATILGTDSVSGKAAAFSAKVGKGEVIFLGASWKYSKHTHRKMFASLMQALGVIPVAQSDNQNVWAVARKGEKRMLFAMNLFSSPMEANIEVDGRTLPIRLGPMETVMVEI